MVSIFQKIRLTKIELLQEYSLVYKLSKIPNSSNYLIKIKKMKEISISQLKKRNKEEQIFLKGFPTVQVITNQYETTFTQNFKSLRVFEIVTDPKVQADSYTIYRQATMKMPDQVKNQLDSSIFDRRGYSLWCMHKSLLTKEQEIKLKTFPPTYEINIQSLKYKITIKLVKQSDIEKGQNLELIIQHLNIKMKHLILKQSGMKQMSPNVFFPKWSLYQRDVKMHIQARIGFKFTMSKIQIQLYCDVNSQIKVLNDKNLLQTIYQNKSVKPQHYIDKRVSKLYGNRECFIIHQFDYKKNPMSKFTRENGKQISYVDYYKENYKIEIHDLKQPLIVTRSWKKQFKKTGKQFQQAQQQIYLIPELVCLVGLPQKANPRFMKELQLSPNDCLKTANDFVIDVNKSQKEIYIDPINRKGVAHLLPDPSIQVNPFSTIKPRNGTFKVQQEIYEPTEFVDVLIVYSVGSNKKLDRNQIDSIIDLFNKSGKWYKISIKEKFQLEIPDNASPQEWVQEIKKDAEDNQPPSFILLALLEKESTIKDYLKTQLTYKLKIESQAFIREKVNPRQKRSLKIAANIMKQMAAKYNKTLWKLKTIKNFQEKIVLMFGISVQRLKGKFELVICRNSNKNISTFKTQSFMIDSHQIPIQIYQTTIYESIKLFVKNQKVKNLPTTIIVYRMGINNQKYANSMLETQSKLLKQRIKFVAQNRFTNTKFQPQIVYIRVVDHPSIKFWIQQIGNQPNSILPNVVNPEVGTVMKGEDINEFALVSYKPRDGSSKPSLYKVFENEKNLAMSFIAQFTYAQSYMYYNWQGSIRVPQILQYCKKVHQFVKDKENKNFTFQSLSFI